MKKELSKEEKLEKSNKNLKVLRRIMIGFDVLALIVLIMQIIVKDVSYSSYVVLILCNIIAFTVKPNANDIK